MALPIRYVINCAGVAKEHGTLFIVAGWEISGETKKRDPSCYEDQTLSRVAGGRCYRQLQLAGHPSQLEL